MNNFTKILFLDIETVPMVSDYAMLPETMQKLWQHKFNQINRNENLDYEANWQKAGIYAEFGKIICISIGFIRLLDNNYELRIKSFYDNNEKQILLNFKKLVDDFYKKEPFAILCAHNGKEFDFPYIGRRMLLNDIMLPTLLQIQNKKPWEIKLYDTMEFWKFGDFKSYSSLELLTTIFDIPSSKDDINGSQVADYYYVKKEIRTIKNYCEKDVIATARLFLKLNGMFNKEISDNNIVII